MRTVASRLDMQQCGYHFFLTSHNLLITRSHIVKSIYVRLVKQIFLSRWPLVTIYEVAISCASSGHRPSCASSTIGGASTGCGGGGDGGGDAGLGSAEPVAASSGWDGALAFLLQRHVGPTSGEGEVRRLFGKEASLSGHEMVLAGILLSCQRACARTSPSIQSCCVMPLSQSIHVFLK